MKNVRTLSRGGLAASAVALYMSAAQAVAAPASPNNAAIKEEAEAYVFDCDETFAKDCEDLRSGFLRDYIRARHGSYQGQRNVAFMLSGGWQSAPIVKNQIQACAWRYVIIQSAHAEADVTDSANLRLDCGKLDEADRLAAVARGNEILRQIAALAPKPKASGRR